MYQNIIYTLYLQLNWYKIFDAADNYDECNNISKIKIHVQYWSALSGLEIKIKVKSYKKYIYRNVNGRFDKVYFLIIAVNCNKLT